MFGFLQVQALSGALLAVAVMVAAHRPGPLGWQDAAGVALMLLAIGGEGLADAQLARFKANPANHGKVCDAGLWGWSRHPNYFFEWLVWTAWPVIAIGLAWPWGWLALAGPAFMALLLIKALAGPEYHESLNLGQVAPGGNTNSGKADGLVDATRDGPGQAVGRQGADPHDHPLGRGAQVELSRRQGEDDIAVER
jgi:hypothetical protein